MDTKIETYIRFFNKQVELAKEEQRKTTLAPVSQLVRKGEIQVGSIERVNDRLGHLLVSFPKGTAPRMNVLRTITLVTKNARQFLGNSPWEWKCSFEDFLYHKGCKDKPVPMHGNCFDCTPIYFSKDTSSNRECVAFTGVDESLFNVCKSSLEKGVHPMILVYTPLPPTDFLSNMKHFLEIYGDLPENLIEPCIAYDDWKPIELEYDKSNPYAISEEIGRCLEASDCCILQGPPGAGKSYTIASIIAQYLEDGKSVCATTMANKGLIELIHQKPLEKYLKDGKIGKTNLSSDEKRETPELKNTGKHFTVPLGELCCSTSYVLSHAYNPNNDTEYEPPHFDLIIIEEASQAFLSTIVAFKRLADKCLIVGDPMQLTPIYLSGSGTEGLNQKCGAQIEGLKSFALGTDIPAYRITTTFRLSPKAASLTAVFYGNKFNSVQPQLPEFHECKSSIFPDEGGSLYLYTGGCSNGIASEIGLNIIGIALNDIQNHYPKRKVAIISPFIDTVKRIQKEFLTESRLKNLIIETVDRIQGITVDYAIYYIPAGGRVDFALKENRFNVATSRSKSTTLIISDIPVEDFASASAHVKSYINKCRYYDVNEIITHTQTALNNNLSIEDLYPGYENIAKLLISNGYELDLDGDVELTDENGYVVASAGVLLKDRKIAIDPSDTKSEQVFKAKGYLTVTSENFSIDLIET